MLLDNSIHVLFDSYDVSINLDDNHKIVCLDTDGEGIAWRHLDRESELASLYSSVISRLVQRAGERMEYELFSRLVDKAFVL